MTRGKMDALGLDGACLWNFPAWCVSVWTVERTRCGFVSGDVSSRASSGWLGDDQCQTPSSSPPSVQNLTMHFSQLQTRLYTSLHILKSFSPSFFFFFYCGHSLFHATGGWAAFRKQLMIFANNQLLQIQSGMEATLAHFYGPCVIFNLLHAFKHTACWPYKYRHMLQYHERTHLLSCSLSTRAQYILCFQHCSLTSGVSRVTHENRL